MHLPQGIVFLKRSRTARSTRVAHAGDQLLRLFAERIEFLSLVQILGLLSEVDFEFCNQCYRDESPRTSLSDFLRDACDACPREVSDESPRTSRFVRFDGRRMFSLRRP